MNGMRRRFLGGALTGLAALAAGRSAFAQTAVTAPGAASTNPPPSPMPAPAPVEDWPALGRYHDADAVDANLPEAQRRVVMMGDSITDNWARPQNSGSFYPDNGLIGRGISGQVSAQMLIRFMPDVIALKPRAVHILAGTNDIAGNRGPYDQAATLNNIQAMITLAHAYRLKVLIGSVPPAIRFPWRESAGNPHDQIVALNVALKAMAAAQDCIYVDYWPVLATPEGGLKPELGYHGDAVHPGPNGYALMQPLLLAAINQALAG